MIMGKIEYYEVYMREAFLEGCTSTKLITTFEKEDCAQHFCAMSNEISKNEDNPVEFYYIRISFFSDGRGNFTDTKISSDKEREPKDRLIFEKMSWENKCLRYHRPDSGASLDSDKEV